MNVLDYPLLTDENIHPDVVLWLRQTGYDVRTIFDEGLQARADVEILRRAHQTGRVVLTHDSDFGRIALAAGEPMTGIVYVRPGHLTASFTTGSLEALRPTTADIEPPFIAVVERREAETRIRLKRHIPL